MDKKYPYRLVIVEWEDSRQPNGVWRWIDDLPAPAAVQRVSVGFLVCETEAALSIAANLGDTESDRLQCSGVMDIPKRAVKKVTTGLRTRVLS
jgi:hypothetical protein